jgi:pilus assembly protein CpaC
MTRRTLILTASLAAVIAAVGFVATDRAPAADAQVPVMRVISSDATARSIQLGVNKSVVIELPRDIKEVLVGDEKIATAVVRSRQRVFIIGVKVGQTNVYFFDADGRQIGALDIAVTRNLNGLRASLKRVLPNANIHIEGVGDDGVMLSGSASSPAEAQQAFDLAARLVGDKEKVVNGIVVNGRDQVMLKVTVAEVSRQVIKQLGINLSGSASIGSSVVNFNNNNPFPINGSPGTLAIAPALTPNNVLSPISTAPSTSAAGNIGGISKSVTANLQAMDQAGVIHILAEPTLTAISGETANFLAGGRFPYPTPPQTAGGAPGFDYQKFGVSLVFTPVVLSEGRISLKVMTEVSELAPENSVTVAGTTVPGLTVRSAETTVEIPSGGSLAMAGMMQQETKQTITGFPGLMNMPILGALFKSRDYRNNQTELMILVTPYIVHAVAQKQLSRPDDGFADPNDQSSVLLGRLNRIYGVPAGPPKSAYHGNIGFIID